MQRVPVGEHLFDTFHTQQNRLKQGDDLSALLLNLVVKYASVLLGKLKQTNSLSLLMHFLC
jgi:hypothetical protein